MYSIEKQFDFCYGHRVWTQKLDPEFSLDSCHACRRLHGHQGAIHIKLEAEVLTEGMITDFKHLNFFKKWLDDTLDHKFIMDLQDPSLKFLFPLLYECLQDNLVFDRFEGNKEKLSDYYKVRKSVYEHHDLCLQEIYEGLVFVNFVPTSENLSKWILDMVQEKMQPLGVTVKEVKFCETPKSNAIYTP